MNIRTQATALACLFLLNTAVQAVDCQVDFRAKKTVTESRWFGSVKKVVTKTGTSSGTGATKSACEAQALKKITQDGWLITYQKIKTTP